MKSFCCRSCGSVVGRLILDLGIQPLANNLLNRIDLEKPEPLYPLVVMVCESCWLMQITETVPPTTLFSDYVYFSSFSDQMLQHARAASLQYIKQKSLGEKSFVVEVASNDGYLLKNFVEAGVPCAGFEPAENIAKIARDRGFETLCEFFNETTATALKNTRGPADLILANNVFAHAPDTNDFVAGLRSLLKLNGWAILEFPYGVDMIDHVEFDTIYHEHVFYFTLTPLVPLFARHGLDVFHVERIPIHGGSLRLYVCHHGAEPIRKSVIDLLSDEESRGLTSFAYYERFSAQARKVKADLLQFLGEKKARGERVAAYGASAKGSTLLNYLGKAAGSIEFIVDRSTYKHGMLSPGIHLPIFAAEELVIRAPDYALLLVWNFAQEVMAQQQSYRDNGGKFVVPLPSIQIV